MHEPKDVYLYEFTDEGGKKKFKKTALCWGKNRLHIDGFIKTPKGYHLEFKKRRLEPRYLFTILPKDVGIRGISVRPVFAPKMGIAISVGGNVYHIPLFMRYSYDRARGENITKKELTDRTEQQIHELLTIEVDEYAKDREGNIIPESKLNYPTLKNIIYFPEKMDTEFDKERFIEEFSYDIQKELYEEINSMYKDMDSGIHLEDVTSTWSWYMTVVKDNVQHTYRIPDGEVPDNGKEYQFWYFKTFGWQKLYKRYTDHIYECFVPKSDKYFYFEKDSVGEG